MMNDRIEMIKTHLQENKKVYIGTTIGVLVGAVGVIFLSKRFDSGVVQKINQIGFRNEATPMIINLVERSTLSKPVHLVGTNLFFNSLNEAARETGYHLSMISRNVNGHIPDVNGDVFQLLLPAA